MSFKTWKVQGEKRYFKQLKENVWAEFKDNGEPIAYEYLSDNDNEMVVCLKKKDSSFYLKLDSERATSGESRENLDKVFCKGSWVENKDLKSSSLASPEEALSCKR